jgi:hypothetical protein
MVFVEKLDFVTAWIVKYDLNDIKTVIDLKSLVACYLLAKHEGFKTRTIKMTRRCHDNLTEDGIDKMSGEEFFKRFPTIDAFIKEYENDCECWYAGLVIDKRLCSFGGHIDHPARVSILFGKPEMSLPWAKENDVDIEKLYAEIEAQSRAIQD